MRGDSYQHVLLLSDTHGVLDPRILMLARRTELVVHAGDVGNASVLRQLGDSSRVIAIRGNNDVPGKWPEPDRATLDGLPAEVEVDLVGGVLVVVHGHRAGPVAGRHALLRQRYPGARAVVYGHSHRMVCDREARPWILNPGAAGRARTYGGPSCLLLAASKRLWLVKEMRFGPGPGPSI